MTSRLRLGRIQLYIEPRDAWIGVYIDPKAIYVCPLPFVVIRCDRATEAPLRIDTPATKDSA